MCLVHIFNNNYDTELKSNMCRLIYKYINHYLTVTNNFCFLL